MNLLLAAALAAATPPSAQAAPPAPVAVPSLAEASHALGAGRLDQTRAMIAAAVAAGASGEQVDRLLADLALLLATINGRSLATRPCSASIRTMRSWPSGREYLR